MNSEANVNINSGLCANWCVVWLLICFVLSVLFLSVFIYVDLAMLPISKLTHLIKNVNNLARL